mmetsp:Transcript_50581/g.109703  ORF Transcript_50581/g.109703 Transcript_50581/m.109703 type:complete len:310 (-) Transcript_50581:854-1783(-)
MPVGTVNERSHERNKLGFASALAPWCVRSSATVALGESARQAQTPNWGPCVRGRAHGAGDGAVLRGQSYCCAHCTRPPPPPPASSSSSCVSSGRLSLKEETGSMSVSSTTSTSSSSSEAVTVCSGGGSSFIRADWHCASSVAGNSTFRRMKRLPCSKGDLSLGRPSPCTAFIMRLSLSASGSEITKSFEPFEVVFAAMACWYVHCLNTVRPPFWTKQPMPLPRSWPDSHAFLHTLRSSVSAAAASSSPGQSASSKSVHADFSSSLNGSKVLCLRTSPGFDLMISTRSSRCLICILKPQSASLSEMDRSM